MSRAQEAFLPFSRAAIGEEEIAEVVRALRSGWLTRGPRTKAFEAAFAAYTRAAHALAVNSCTVALHLALVASGTGPGDEGYIKKPALAETHGKAGRESVITTFRRPEVLERIRTIYAEPIEQRLERHKAAPHGPAKGHQ